jgi:hypothetical protein
MTDDQTPFEQFMSKVLQRQLPSNQMGRVRLLAKELAEGVSENVFPTRINLNATGRTIENFRNYLQRRWNDDYPQFELLALNGYLGLASDRYEIRRPAFELLEEAPPSTSFISYKRSDSSAFALLVLTKLKAAGLEPFLDMALVPGEDWHAGLKERIQQRDYFVLLLGENTLKSEYVQKEILWALEVPATVIPIWQPGFEYSSGKYNVPPEIDQVLSASHSIRVFDDSPLGYNTAIVELLNRFGITP